MKNEKIQEILSIINKRLEKAKEYRNRHKMKNSSDYYYYRGKCAAFEIIESEVKRILNA